MVEQTVTMLIVDFLSVYPSHQRKNRIEAAKDSAPFGSALGSSPSSEPTSQVEPITEGQKNSPSAL